MSMQLDNNKNDNVNNGFFEILFRQDGVYLIVHPPMDNGKRVTVSDVLNKLTKKQIRNFDRAAVDAAVLRANQTPHRIAEPQEEQKLDADVSVSISPDRMKAGIVIIPPEGGRMLTAEEIMRRLNESGIVFGINDNVIYQMVRDPIFNQQIAVAEGVAPVNGTNGKIEYSFDIHKDARPTIMEDGRVNFRELNLIENVSKGQVLATSTLPTPGKPGMNVLGAGIQALDGKSATLPRGKNVEISDDGQTLLAGLDGHVCYIDGKVNVFALYEAQADVDNSTGNIYFIGNVLVHGNVLSGFTIEAGGNVEVVGVVEGARIKAGGNIILRRGMQGVGKGLLVCDGDIVARYIEHSNVEARGDIKSEAIMHSNVKCGGKLELAGKKGLLVGGSAKVGKEVSAKVIGSPMATVTDIEVGVDPALRERYKDIKEEIKNAESDIKKAEQAIDMLGKLKQAGRITPEKEEMMTKSARTRLYYINRVEELKEEVQRIEEALEEESSGRILVQSIMYPGTRVAIGTCMMNVRENLQYCTLYKDGADIRVGAYNK